MGNDKENVITIKDNSNKLAQNESNVLNYLKSTITQERVGQIINIAGRVVDARLEAGLIEAKSTNKIREILIEFQNDSNRCERAAEYYEMFKDVMSEEERGQIAVAIIKVQLGQKL